MCECATCTAGSSTAVVVTAVVTMIIGLVYQPDQMTLSCTVRSESSSLGVIWMKDGETLLQNNPQFNQRQERTSQQQLTRYILESDDSSNFVGIFECSVNDGKVITRSVELNGVNIFVEPNNMFVSGQPATIICLSDLEATSIEWLDDQGRIFSKTDSSDTGVQRLAYEIAQVNDSIHNSEYVCRVQSRGMTEQSLIVNVNVDTTSVLLTSNVTTSGNNDVGPMSGYTLTCTVRKEVSHLTGTPSATWLVGNVPLVPGNGISISSPSDDVSTTTLNFFPLRTSHAGEYECRGSLESPALTQPIVFSKTEAVIVKISVTEPIITRGAESGPLYTGTRTTINCTLALHEQIDTDVLVDITWQNDSAIISNEDDRVTISSVIREGRTAWKSLTISPLTRRFDNNTLLKCFAVVTPVSVNPLTQSLILTSERTIAQTPIIVHSPPKPVLGISTFGDVMAGELYQLNCMVSTVRNFINRPEVSWTKEGFGEIITRGDRRVLSEEVGQMTTMVLSFLPLKTSHGGMYDCNALIRVPVDNDLIQSSTSTMLVVRIPDPEMDISEQETMSNLEGLSDIMLTCTITVSSAVDTTINIAAVWLRDEQLITVNQTVSTTDVQEIDNSGVYVTTLLLNEVSRSIIHGAYYCRVTLAPTNNTFVEQVTTESLHIITSEVPTPVPGARTVDVIAAVTSSVVVVSVMIVLIVGISLGCLLYHRYRHLCRSVTNSSRPIVRRGTNKLSLTTKPKMKHLVKFHTKNGTSMNVIQRIASKYSDLGILLLCNNDTGSRVTNLEEQHSRNNENITKAILREWLSNGDPSGRPVTWDTFIKTLDDIGLSQIARQIHESIAPGEV